MMFSSEMRIHAMNRKRGMDREELLRAVAQAGEADFTEIGRVEVGFKGQIQSIRFVRAKEKGIK